MEEPIRKSTTDPIQPGNQPPRMLTGLGLKNPLPPSNVSVPFCTETGTERFLIFGTRTVLHNLPKSRSVIYRRSLEILQCHSKELELGTEQHSSMRSIEKQRLQKCIFIFHAPVGVKIMPRLNCDEKKLALLERISEHKHILFNNNVKKQEKLDKWRDIFIFAREVLNYWVPETAVFTYLRDAVWPNMRNSALQKRKKIRADTSINIGDDPSKFDLYFSPLEQKVLEIVSYYDGDVLDFSTLSMKNEENSFTTTSNMIKKEILGEMETERGDSKNLKILVSETPGSCCEAANSINGVITNEVFDADGSSENEILFQKETTEESNKSAETHQACNHQKAENYDSTVNLIKNLKRKRPFSGLLDFEGEKKQLHIEMLRLQNEKLRKELRLMEIQECKALLELRILERQLNEG
uniref:Uncharacterized protein n=1 Tax=Romanomermis culicivorax TaxID=13658 RepID=A0A915I9H7_ROMCU